jgi:hypothetical protein
MESELDPRQAHLDLTREGFYAFFPMPGEKRFRLVGRVPRSWRGRRRSRPETFRRSSTSTAA